MFLALQNLVSPRVCLFCGVGNDYICPKCFEINFLNPQLSEIQTIQVLSMSRYQDLVREIIVRHKDHHFLAVRKYLSMSLAYGLKLLDVPRDCVIISIPTVKSQITKRLDDPVRYMIADAAKSCDLLFTHRVLSLQSSKKDQAGLSFLQREKNVKNIFKVSKRVKQVVICDDLVTSGATLAAANRVLIQAGIKVIANICVANTPKTTQSIG